jgi:Tfp pilus assembly protein PilE
LKGKAMINTNKIETTKSLECSADTKLFFDDVYKSGTREKKQQVDVLQYGRSMIEMLGVLAIVGVLSVGGIAGYSKAMEKFKINKTIDQISHIIANIQTLYAQQSAYDIRTETSSREFRELIFNTDVTWNNNQAYHPFNGKYEVETWQHQGNAFELGLAGIPKEACITLATMDWGSSQSSINSLMIGTGNYISHVWDNEQESRPNCKGDFEISGGYRACSDKLPIPVATAAKYCNSNENTHIFKIIIEK